MYTVQVMSQSTGKPVYRAKVVISAGPGVSSPEYTDSDGCAHFHYEPEDGKVIVDGWHEFRVRLEGKVQVWIP